MGLYDQNQPLVNQPTQGGTIPQQVPVAQEIAPEPINPISEAFKTGQSNASSQYNPWLGVLHAVISDNPMVLFDYAQKRSQIEQNQKVASNLLNTPEFKALPLQYQTTAAQFIGQGDIDNAQQYINAGRESRNREVHELQKKTDVGIAQDLVKGGSVPSEFEALVNNAASQGKLGDIVGLLKTIKTEKVQGLNKQSEALSKEAADIKSGGMAVNAERLSRINQKVQSAVQAKRVMPADFDISPSNKKAIQKLANQLLLPYADTQMLVQEKKDKGVRFGEKGWLDFGGTSNVQPQAFTQEMFNNLSPDEKTAFERQQRIAGEQEKLKQESADTKIIPGKVKEIKRQTKDGKTAIFDEATKKFLRYE